MSKDCDQCTVDRRSLLGMAGLGMAAAMAIPGVRPAMAASASATALTSDQALAALKDGNKRYVSNPQLCTLDLAKHRGSCRRASGALGDHRRLRRQSQST